MAVRFGHDGWHGTLAREVTFNSITAVSRAAATVMGSDYPEDARVVIGFDRRFMAEEFARAICAELAALGIEPWLIPRPSPVPVVSFLIQSIGAVGGIVVTAGHLPSTVSGIKLRAEDGGALPRGKLTQIESTIAAGAIPAIIGPTAAMAEVDPTDDYLDSIAERLPVHAIQRAGLTVAVDPMWGAVSELLPRLIDGDGSRSVEIRNIHNPRFPGLDAPDPTEQNLSRLSQVVSNGSATLGIAFSGDGGTLAAIDEHGSFVSGDTVFALITQYLLGVERRRGTLVRSVAGSTVVDRLASAYGAAVQESPVGYTSLSDAVREHEPLLAGDEWGGIVFPEHLPDRDALLAATMLCTCVVETGEAISELIDELHDTVGRLALRRVEIPLTGEQAKMVRNRLQSDHWPFELAGIEVSEIAKSDGVRLEMAGESWALLRLDEYDSTLQLVAESHDDDISAKLLEAMRGLMLA